jgi:hypothetical protein
MMPEPIRRFFGVVPESMRLRYLALAASFDGRRGRAVIQ